MFRLAWILGACFSALFLFHALLYRRIPVPDGAPHGLGDVLDLIGTLLCWLIAAASALLALILAAVKKTTIRRAALVIGLAIFLVALSRIVDFRYWTLRL